MDGVSAFVHGLWTFIIGVSAGVAGVIVMSVSLTLFFSLKPVRRSVPILAVIGTLLLLPAIWILCIGSLSGSAGVFVGVILLATTILIVFYDIKVIKKYIADKRSDN